MKFTPTTHELLAAKSEAADNRPSNLTAPGLHVSGSHWDVEHLRALRVLAFDNMAPEKLVPLPYMPQSTSNEFGGLIQAIQAPSRAEIRLWEATGYQNENNPFNPFFSSLSDAMTKMDDIVARLRPGEGPAYGDALAEESESSQEDELEGAPRQALQALARVVARHVSKVNAPFRMQMHINDIPLKLYLGPDQGRPSLREARNDGGIVLVSSHDQTHGSIPLVGFESKRRHAAGAHHYTGQPETYNRQTLAQEVAELLAQALAGYRLDGPNQDEEAFLLTIHGTQLRLVTAYFTADYLRHVQSTTMPVDQFLFVRRSRFYELKEPAQRVEALKLIIGLFRYVVGGYAQMKQITGFANILRQHYGL
ncbi:hypothetical protein FQN50_002796 [Emmonsiellopsis sp. PD_5]|nr:hypothetical protein FQN50_002796 [Emmonsiellopsis sp. PD_5]